MLFKKETYLIIFLLFATFVGKSQMSLSFSPIAFSTSGVTATGGTPLIINGAGKCLTVGSGLSSLTIAYNNNGTFGESCKEVAPIAAINNISVSLKLYPNPTNGPVTIKCEGQFDANLYCQLRVFTLEGRMMMNKMVLMQEIKAGYLINANNYAAGTYVITIDFMNERYNTKMIKL